MCGIIGAIGEKDVTPLLMEGLARLEYRGYDSAGVAVLSGGGVERLRAKGALSFLRERLEAAPLSGLSGVGHTRWATHGAPSEKNAHPHMAEGVAIVHNGIIENFAALKSALLKEGVIFTSDTDSEVIAHLIRSFLERGMAADEAFARALEKLEGAFGVVALMADAPDTLFAASRRSPLVIGEGEAMMLIASDAMALAPHARRFLFMDDGELARLGRGGAEMSNGAGAAVKRPFKPLSQPLAEASKGRRRFFMEKEIFECPDAAERALRLHTVKDMEKGAGSHIAAARRKRLREIIFVGCGSAAYAGLAASYWMESLAGLSARAEVASEFRYKGWTLSDETLVVLVSQSGETADTLSALRQCGREGVPNLAVVNVMESTMARLADDVLPIAAGPEVGVAATKTLICQMITLASLALSFAWGRRGDDDGVLSAELEGLRGLSGALRRVLDMTPHFRSMARERIAPSDYVLYLGRGVGYPVALEGALKCKEIAYIPSDGYPAGEMKHGPIALAREGTPVVAIAPHDRLFPKMLSNMEEIAARGGRLCVLTDRAGAEAVKDLADMSVILPEAGAMSMPILYSLGVQILAYETALALGHNPDRPRNLAKSVTVE